ncbi:PEBP-like protein [Aulographum hederae CBS 113979]|uniref:PEBP-like protein n=1 Tax=Aulographum hederae CBS 113979 TaxID=1176131 RepID=A0A6G1GWJ9_9PEZI|nr:PEBP-like protein [Aulographum hederae CBS 113979]
MQLTNFVTAAAFALPAFAQTPPEFQPGSQQNLGVTFQPALDITPGKVVATTDVRTQPQIRAPAGLPPTQKYMIFMIDIDVVQNGTATTVLHWFQPDMTLDPQTNLVVPPPQIDTANAAPYFGPGPPPGPAHRYVQALFAQPGPPTQAFKLPSCFAAITQRSGRLGFDVQQFVQVNGLQPAVAGNFLKSFNAASGPNLPPVAPTATRLSSAAACAATGVQAAKRLVDVLW